MATSVTSVGAPLVPQPGLSSLGQGARVRAGETGDASHPLNDSVADTWRGARDAARSGLASLSLSAAAGRQAGALLDEIAAAAQEGRTQDVQSLVERLRVGVQSAIGGGASLLAGQSLRLDLNGEAGAFQVEGADLRFAPPPEAALATDEGAQAVGAAASQAAREARGFAAQWDEAVRKLSAHEGVLAAATQVGQGAGVRDLDAEGARLLALQVRQSLSEAGAGMAIANGDPRALLALFKA